MLAEVRKLNVERQKDTTFPGRTCRNLDIRARQQILIRCGQYVLTQASQDWLEVAGQVLIEFESHALTVVFHSPS
jgi:hypothetical protein